MLHHEQRMSLGAPVDERGQGLVGTSRPARRRATNVPTACRLERAEGQLDRLALRDQLVLQPPSVDARVTMRSPGR